QLSVVVPLFNEQENVVELYRRLTRTLAGLRMTYEIILADDRSRDRTVEFMDSSRGQDPLVAVLRVSPNFGHQPAVPAGRRHAPGGAVVVMDGDLQDPPEVIPQLVACWRRGHEVVYAVRRNRKEHALKRFAYFAFYRLLRAISDIEIPLDS